MGGQGGGAGTCRESGVAPRRRWCPRKACVDFQDPPVRGCVKCPRSLRGQQRASWEFQDNGGRKERAGVMSVLKTG